LLKWKDSNEQQWVRAEDINAPVLISNFNYNQGKDKKDFASKKRQIHNIWGSPEENVTIVWSGPAIESDKTKLYYDSVRVNNIDYKIGDCVFLNVEQDNGNFEICIAKIMRMFETRSKANESKKFIAQWYYYPEHTKIGRQKDNLENEVYASTHEDTNQIGTIGGLCYVLNEEEYNKIMQTTPPEQNITSSGKPKYYVCRKVYDCIHSKILDMSVEKKPSKKRKTE